MTRTATLARGLVVLAAGLWLSLARTPAQERAVGYDPAFLKTSVWRNIGPYRGGRVTAVAGVPGQPLTYYFGATGGGVWKTEDAGITWNPVTDAYFKTGSVGAIAVADADPNVVYVGMGEACVRSNFSEGDGVYKSTDGGKTWSHLGLDDTRQIGKIRIHPTNADLVYVAALGNVFGPSTARGVFRSRDGGKTWESVLFVDDITGASDIAMDPINPRVLYAGFWQVRRKPWTMTSGGPGSGLYRSTDGGDTWVQLTRGLPGGIKGRIGVTVSPVRRGRVWASVEASEGGIFRSDDGGDTWTKVNAEAKTRDRPWYYSHIYADTQDPETVYVLTLQLHKSIDGGRTYQAIPAPHGDHHDLWIAPEDSQRLINANDGGVNVSFNGGRSWSTQENQATAQFYHVITDTQFPYRVYGAQQDNTTVSIASRTSSDGIERTDWYTVGGGESGYVAPNPDDPNVVYAGSYYGLLTRYDHRTEQLRNITVWPDTPGGRAAADVKYRFQWTFPIVISPHEPGTLYAAGNVLFKSTDGGQSWTPISADLTRHDESTLGPSGGSLTGDNSSADYYGTIFTVAESPRARGMIWTGSDDGLVHVTTDEGKTWRNVTPPQLGDFTRISMVEASPHEAAKAYLAVNRYQMDDRRPYIYKTVDAGKSWTLVASGVPDGAFVRVVREDPTRPGLLYAGTERGVYVSWDDGANWQSLQRNLPLVPVTDLTVKDGDLVASTQGRAFWILDDLSPLRQLTKDVTSSSAYLFQPRPAYRFGSRPRSQPATGDNPPSGVLVHYYLQQEPKGEVTLEFVDSGGHLVQRFASATEQAAAPADPFEVLFGAGRGQRRVPAAAGMNRFEWDMRYPDPAGPPRGVLLFGAMLRGPVAVPGTYQVKLTANGRTLAQSFEIRKDPRLSTTAEEFQKQFDLLIQIRDRITEAHRAVDDILRIRKELAATVDRARTVGAGPDVAASAQRLDDALGQVLGELIEMRIKYGNDVLSYPVKLNNRLAALASVVASAEAQPTAQSYQVFEDLGKALDAQLARLGQILGQDVPAFNQLVQQKGVPAVVGKAPVPK